MTQNCERCGVSVELQPSGLGYWTSYNLDGSPHLGSCSAVGQDRQNLLATLRETGVVEELSPVIADQRGHAESFAEESKAEKGKRHGSR